MPLSSVHRTTHTDPYEHNSYLAILTFHANKESDILLATLLLPLLLVYMHHRYHFPVEHQLFHCRLTFTSTVPYR